MFTLTAKSSGFIYTLQLIIHVFIFSLTCRNLRWYGTSVHISMWIKINFNQYTFTVLEFSSSAIFDQTVSKIVGKVKFLKPQRDSTLRVTELWLTLLTDAV